MASANAIYGRFIATTQLEPERVVFLNEDASRQIGLSRQKLSYLHDLAVHFVDEPDIYDHLERSTDEDAIAELVAVKGIGVWTAQIFLMFTLGRPDIFSLDDVGLQNAIKRIYGDNELPPKQDLIKLTERLRPYRSVASMHLWQSLNNSSD